MAEVNVDPGPTPEPTPEPPSTLDQVLEIAGVERHIADLQRQIDTAQAYRKQLYSDLNLDVATEVLDVAVVAKPIGK